MEQLKAKLYKRVRLPSDLDAVERFNPSMETGLTTEQVGKRFEQGLVNVDTNKKGKSILGIILSNIFTFFNVVYIIITVVLCIYGLVGQCTFVPVVVANTAIAIVQEIKSKLTLDKLNLITEPHIKILRNGKTVDGSVNELVLDDIVYVGGGEQISADCVVLDGFVEVNEAILTGESDAVVKRKGDVLYAGSFVLSGSCTAQVVAIGKFNYVAKLTGRARQYQKPRSQMLKALHGILYFVAIVIVPMTICLYMLNAEAVGASDWSNFSLVNLNKQALTTTAGSIISMIPAGPFLLTSIALAASFLRLARNNTMVQELYCIEMLARVDTLCLDKTGTITDGSMRVIESIDLRQQTSASYTLREIMSSINTALKADNMTSKALKKYFGSPKKPALEASVIIPFSSERKLSAVSFKNNGTYILGAPEFVLKTPNERVTDLVNKYAAQGLRVLLLAHSATSIYNDTLPQTRRPIAVIVIEDHIRSDAKDTIEWFKKNDVQIKVISGDNPSAVSSIALRVGVENAENYINLDGLTEEEVRDAATKYTVFGRVSPDQKAILVKALKAAGCTVAMTGDGVNDILAMKESDCSISLAGGCDAARQVSHLILMDDSFSNLPKVVAEGRRVVNNIQSATSMYFMKTVYVIVINILLILLHFGFKRTMQTPLTNLRVTLMDWVVVALPTTLLALQPNEKLIKGNFFANVLKRCLPASITFIITTAVLYVLHATDVTLVPPEDTLSTMVTLTYTFGGLFALFYACQPFNRWKGVMFVGIWAIVILCVSVPTFANLLSYVQLQREQILLVLVEILATPFILYACMKIFHREKPLKGKLPNLPHKKKATNKETK
ncbi:MAG: HAD-IC family P-type ATPase [Clostridiales bacterium]|nr:HAD-IC family P-type ATPase [Clostridiales bacterium]